jgi:hypothetical protein
MKKLNVEQKIEAIIAAKERIKEKQSFFLCGAIEAVLLKLFNIKPKLLIYNVFEYIPELLKYKPENVSEHCAWWEIDEEGRRIRIKVLNKLLRHLRVQLKKQQNEK